MSIKPYTRTKVQCVETGLIYESVTELSKAMNISKSSIVNHLNRPHFYPHVRGWHFVRVAVPLHTEKGNYI